MYKLKLQLRLTRRLRLPGLGIATEPLSVTVVRLGRHRDLDSSKWNLKSARACKILAATVPKFEFEYESALLEATCTARLGLGLGSGKPLARAELVSESLMQVVTQPRSMSMSSPGHDGVRSYAYASSKVPLVMSTTPRSLTLVNQGHLVFNSATRSMNTVAATTPSLAITPRNDEPVPVIVAGNGDPEKSLSSVNDQPMQRKPLSVEEELYLTRTDINSVVVEINELKEVIAATSDVEEKNKLHDKENLLIAEKNKLHDKENLLIAKESKLIEFRQSEGFGKKNLCSNETN